jgi:hypothetical protein
MDAVNQITDDIFFISGTDHDSVFMKYRAGFRLLPAEEPGNRNECKLIQIAAQENNGNCSVE